MTEVRTRLHVLWLSRRREGPTAVAAAVGSHRRCGPGKPSFLTRDEEKQVVAEAATGVLATAQAVRDWIEDRFGVLYTVGSLYTLLPRLELWNAVRRVWAPRGVEVSREVQINRQYTYVAVALNPLTGDLWWAWQADPARVWQLCGWEWVREALTRLPTDTQVV